MIGRADRWIRRTTIGCVAMLALIAGTVSYLHMHLLVELHGQPGAYELLMRQIRHAAENAVSVRRSRRSLGPSTSAVAARAGASVGKSGAVAPGRNAVGRDVWLDAWQWAQNNQTEDGSLPSGRDIGNRYGRHERWGRLVKRSGLAGELAMLAPKT